MQRYSEAGATTGNGSDPGDGAALLATIDDDVAAMSGTLLATMDGDVTAM